MKSSPINLKSPTLHLTIWFTITVFVTLIALSCVFKVEVVARGQGRVVPISRVQVVQPEFDGKVTAIHVRNGDEVIKGDVLVELDTTDTDAEANTIASEITRLKIEGTRIAALITGIELGGIEGRSFSDNVISKFKVVDVVENAFFLEQRQLLAAEIDDLQSSLRQNDAKMTSSKYSVEVTKTNIARVNAILGIQKERLDVAKKLLSRGATSRFSFLDFQETFTALEKEHDVYTSELKQKLSQGNALNAERKSILTKHKSLLLKRRSDITARLSTLSEQLRIAKRRIKTALLLAPMDGRIDQLKVFTVGAIAISGEEFLRVVPKDQEFEIEAQFSNNNIGFISIGQVVNIDLDAYPSERFGYLKGTVTDVAADSSEIGDGNWAYIVRVKPHSRYLKSVNYLHKARPGMTGRIDIITDKRRLISYFFAPIIEVLQKSIGEA